MREMYELNENQLLMLRMQAVSGVGRLTSHRLRTTPLLVTAKFGLVVGFDPSEKSKIQIRS